MKRFGYVIRVGGDPEISGALAEGIRAGTPEEIRNTGSDAVRRVAMMRHTPEEWARMTEDARVFYGGRAWCPKWAKALLVGYAMLCYGMSRAFRAQDRILGKE